MPNGFPRWGRFNVLALIGTLLLSVMPTTAPAAPAVPAAATTMYLPLVHNQSFWFVDEYWPAKLTYARLINQARVHGYAHPETGEILFAGGCPPAHLSYNLMHATQKWAVESATYTPPSAHSPPGWYHQHANGDGGVEVVGGGLDPVQMFHATMVSDSHRGLMMNCFQGEPFPPDPDLVYFEIGVGMGHSFVAALGIDGVTRNGIPNPPDPMP